MILVTGGSGLVGSAIEADVKLSSKDVDLRDWKSTLDLFKHYKKQVGKRIILIYFRLKNQEIVNFIWKKFL